LSICDCTDCQALTGTAYRVTVPTLIKDFELRSGSPKVYIKTGDSGAKRAQGVLLTLRLADLRTCG
jgi:hypothetical protein